MYIKNLHITSFGALKNKDITFEKGLNIIEGKNEAGKSTVAMFIKFMLYGLSGRGNDGEMSERGRYVSWDTGSAEGSMTVSLGSGDYKIERELFVSGDGGDSAVRERVYVTDVDSGERVFRDQVPGVALLGMPEKVFVNTVFVKQSGGKVDGEGLTEAIENILLSGDESLSTKKAADKLDKLRKALKYKKGSGGLIYELCREEERLSSKLEAAKKNSAEIIALECKVGELQDKVEARTAESEHCGALSDAYEKLQKKRRLDEGTEYKSQLDAIDERLAELEKYGNITDKTRSIHSLSSEADSSEVKIKEIRRHLDDLDRELPPELGSGDASELREDVFAAASSRRAAAVLRTFGIIALVLAAAYLLFVLLTARVFTLPGVAGSAVGAAIGVLLICLSAAKTKKYKKILAAWSVSSIERLSAAVEDHISRASSRRDPQSEYGMTKRALEKAEAERWAVLAELRELCSVFCEENEDNDVFVKNALDAAETVSAELEDTRQRRREVNARYEMTMSSLGSNLSEIEENARLVADTDVGREAMTLDAGAAAQLLTKKRFADSSLPELNRTLTDKEGSLRALRASTANPAALACELEGVRRDREKAERRFEAVVCALEALERAGESLKRSLMPRIVSEAGASMADFTEGKYKKLGASRSFEISFESDGKTREGAYFSAGTADVAYISLRGALLRVLFPDDTPPAVYDESFARIDEGRLYRILSVLEAAPTAQSLVFTCRSLEGRLAERFDGVNMIKL